MDYPGTGLDVALKYDGLGRLTNVVDGLGTTKFTYNAAGELVTEDGPWDNDTVTYTHENRQRTGLSLEQASGVWTNGYQHDVYGRLTNVTSAAGSFGYEYDPQRLGLVSKLSAAQRALHHQ